MYKLITDNGKLDLGGLVYVNIPGFNKPAEFRFLGAHFEKDTLMATIQGNDTEPVKEIRIDALYPTEKDAMIANIAEKARRELERFQMWYAFGYDDEQDDYGSIHSFASVGIRSKQDVNIMGTMWMLSGDAYDQNGERITDIKQMSKMSPDEFTVKVRMQGLLNGDIVQVPLGEFKCVENKWPETTDYWRGRGFLDLTI